MGRGLAGLALAGGALVACGSRTGVLGLLGDGADVEPPQVVDSGQPAPGACEAGTPTGREPPPRVAASPPGVTRWFAIDTLSLAIGAPVSDLPGFDLDAPTCGSLVPAAACAANAGAPPDLFDDGPHGVDDAFSRFLLPALAAHQPNLQSATDAFLVDGDGSLIFRIDVAGQYAEQNNAHAPGAVYESEPLGDVPGYTNGNYSVVDTSLEDGRSLSLPKLRFDDAYVSASTWVSGDLASAPSMTIPVPMMGSIVDVPLDRVRVTIGLRRGVGVSGVLSGEAPASALAAALAPAMTRLAGCPGSTDPGPLGLYLARAADRPSGGDPSAPCDRVSFAIAFTTVPITAPEAAYAPSKPRAVRCR